MAAYLATRLINLAGFPIYFFCDEAIQQVLASHLVHNGFRDGTGILLPAFFRNVEKYNLGLSVYAQVVPVWLFGYSVWLTRATSVAIGALLPVATMLTLRDVFRAKLWWAAGLVAASLPAWFLHSRTAFETAEAVGFYAVFIYAWLRARCGSPWWLLLTATAAAATAYSYSNGQGWIIATTLLLALTESRFVWRVIRNRPAVVVTTIVLLALLASPYVTFRLSHPNMFSEHLAAVISPWADSGSVTEKTERTATEYLQGLSPFYWFGDNDWELARHRMRGYGHLPYWSTVFVAIGLVCAVWRWRDPRWRVVLIAIAAAPFSAALAEILVTRVLAMMVPATLLITLGLEEVYRRLPGKTPKRIAAGAIAVGLTGWAVWMTSDALRNGPTWFSDYGMDGLQYGARQLFTALAEAHRNDPNRRFLVDISWANNPEAFKEFFLDPEARHAVIFDGLEEFRSRRYDLDDGKTTFVMTKRILDKALETGVVDVIRQSEVLPYPDGSPGFLFVELAYTEAAEGIIAAELERLRAPVHASATVNGEVFDIIHPRLDIGRIEDVFDDNPRTLARTRDANPCRFDLTPNTPIRLAAVSVQLGGDQYKIAVTVIPADGDQPIRIERQFVNLPPDLWITVEIPGGPVRARGLSMTISRPGDGHIHIREIRLE